MLWPRYDQRRCETASVCHVLSRCHRTFALERVNLRRIIVFLIVALVAGVLVSGVDAGIRPDAVYAQTPPTPPVPPQPPPREQPPPQEQPPQSQPPPRWPPVPEGAGEGRRVVYSNAQHRVWLVQGNGEVVDSWLVSGRKGVPSVGTYSVFSKSRHSSARGGRVRMEYMTRFVRGRRLAIGFHSIPVYRRDGRPIQGENELGQYRSAGCVRQRNSDAAKMWEFASMGTTVVVVESSKAKRRR